jgi:hypothetical protein
MLPFARLCAAVMFSMFAPSVYSQTYSVEVHPTLNGLDVRIEPITATGMLVMKLTNNSAQKVRCDLRYDAAPQPRYRRTTYIEAGKTEQSEFRATRHWSSVSVDINCKPVDKKG